MNKFALIIVVATSITFAGWLFDFIFYRKARKERLRVAKAANPKISKKEIESLERENGFVDFCRGLFPVLFVVFIIRSFFLEPFRIPSASMMPTLQDGDFIAVNKLSYGIKNPFTNVNLIDTWAPARGDIAVFRYPVDPNVDFIKRIIGLPGDKVIYRGKRLYVKPACDKKKTDKCEAMISFKVGETSPTDYAVRTVEAEEVFRTERATETADGVVEHDILLTVGLDAQNRYQVQDGHPNEWIVPEGHYFVMGDNRDNSMDSRFWGFVPFDYLIGKTTFIWLSLEWKQNADGWWDKYIPSIRFDRMGFFK